MSAKAKTEALVRTELPVADLLVSQENPNVMSDREFNLLCDNIETMGFTEPVLVVPVEGGKYRIIGGHHRVEAAKVLGFDSVPCTIKPMDGFDEDQRRFQLVRMNMIHGKLSPQKFMDLYTSLSDRYADEVLKESFGFSNDEEFKKLIKNVAADLPDELKGKFKTAAKEIRTIDDLVVVLNRLFTQYGNTVPYGYMIVDFGGKEHVWVRMNKKQKANLLSLGERCMDSKVSLDAVLTSLIDRSVDGDLEELIAEIISSCPPVVIPEVMPPGQLPTLDFLEDL